jgi:hypothetical protein
MNIKDMDRWEESGSGSNSPAMAPRMKASRIHQFGGIDSILLESIPIPSSGIAQVLVQTQAVGVGVWDALIRPTVEVNGLPR